MVKFNPKYSLFIETSDGYSVTIEPPFSVEFNIVRKLMSGGSDAKIRIFNLSQKNQLLILKDRMSRGLTDTRKIIFRAGYGTNLPIAFSGWVSQAFSTRETDTMVTEISAYDGGTAFANAQTSVQFPSGTSQETVIDTFVSNLAPFGVEKGAIGDYPGQISRGNSYVGNTVELLTEITGGGFFIDNNTAHCLNDNECLSGDVLRINSETGLLGVPIREESYLNFDMIFEPRLIVGQKIFLESLINPNFNGYYKVIGISHTGMISESVQSSATTSVQLIAANSLIEVK